MNYPTQAFVKEQIRSGKWPAADGEILDIRSLSDKEIKYIELYNQEEIIKQLRRIGDLLEGQTLECVEDETPEPAKKKSFLNVVRDFVDDGELNDSVKE